MRANQSPNEKRINTMKNYLLTIFQTEAAEQEWANMTPEEMQAGLKAYMDYTQKLIDEGRMIAGEGLSMNGASLKMGPNGVAVTDGPYVLAKELVGGFFLFKAESLEDAIETAKACPALFHGGTVEVREQMDY
jgi:hypothetical protein